MGDGYAVNIAELGTLINTLDDGAQQIRRANKKLADKDQSDLGSEKIATAAGAFDEEWEWGLDKLDDAAKGVVERLRSARKNYQQLEEANRELLNKTEQGLGSGNAGEGSSRPPDTGPAGAKSSRAAGSTRNGGSDDGAGGAVHNIGDVLGGGAS